jgi:hypothetical protein
MRKHAVRWVAAAVGVGLLVGGISAAVADQGSPSPSTSSAAKQSPDFGEDGPGPSDTPDPALSDQPVPTLPPGDPGDGSQDTATPGPKHGDDEPDPDAPDNGRLATVPAAVLLDAQTVGAVAGGTWAAGGDAAAAVEACLTDTPAGAAAGRSSVLVTDDASGRLVQQVATWRSVRAARAGVETVAAALAACGFTGTGDPRLGDASAQLERAVDGGAVERVVVIAAEGATVTLTGSGPAAADGTWESLADLAMGGLCTAGVHGCH